MKHTTEPVVFIGPGKMILRRIGADYEAFEFTCSSMVEQRRVSISTRENYQDVDADPLDIHKQIESVTFEAMIDNVQDFPDQDPGSRYEATFTGMSPDNVQYHCIRLNKVIGFHPLIATVLIDTNKDLFGIEAYRTILS